MEPKAVNEPAGSVSAEPGYHRVQCYNRDTKEFLGWLGTYDANVWIISKDNYEKWKDYIAYCKFSYASGDDTYLEKSTVPYDRWLGLGDSSYAVWGLTGGRNNPIIYNADHTISLKEKPERKLYGPYGHGSYVCWSDNDNNQNIITLVMETTES